jgi:recombination protein RecA
MRDCPLADPLSPQGERPAGRDPAPRETSTRWRLSALAGRLVEISGNQAGACLTLVFRLVLEAQRRAEPAAWIGRRESCFFPPDAADLGVDLAALPVVRAPDPLGAARAADLLLRSGAFGLVVLDFGADARLPLHAQSRLTGLARQHGTALICITEKEADRPSLGPLVSLRAHTARIRQQEDRFLCEARALKDKRRGPGWTHEEICLGPDGLR